MTEILEQYPSFTTSRFSLCDHIIDQIIVSSEDVTFVFPEGFSIVGKDGDTISESGYVRIVGSSAHEDISCWIIKRKATKQGSKLFGKPISLSKLSLMMKRKGRKIQLFSEMYEQHRLYWRGVLLPCKLRGLSTWVIFETIHDFQIEFGWKEPGNTD